MDKRTASVTVRFVTHQINITRDAGGKIIDGDPHEAVEVVDIWTFERHTRARDPNWTLGRHTQPALMPTAWRAALGGALLLLSACTEPPPEEPSLALSPVGFGDLAGWTDDDHAAALTALERSCARFAKLPDDRAVGPDGLAGTIADWRDLCAAAAGAQGAARAFFEDWFVPFKATDRGRDEGLFTGYYEPLLHGALAESARYATPLYGRPDDLVTVELGAFDDELQGQAHRRPCRRWQTQALRVPRRDRRRRARQPRPSRSPGVDDPVDAFFLHVQGSGRVALDDGGMLRVGYARPTGATTSASAGC